MSRTLLIFGGHSTALEIQEVASKYYARDFDDVRLVINDKETKQTQSALFDSEVEEYTKKRVCNYLLSFSNGKLRKEFEKRMTSFKLTATNIIHPSAIISDSAQVGLGNYIAGNTVISSNATIGDHNIINFNTVLGHDCLIKNHVIINPGARISGHVKIGSCTLLGANSFVFQGKSIGNDTVVDALTYIDRDIESGMICSSRQLKVYKRVIF